MHIILSNLDNNILENILRFHSPTVCDTTSLFSGISKTKCYTQYPEAQKRVHLLDRGLKLVSKTVCFTCMAAALKRIVLFESCLSGTKYLNANNSQMNVGTATDTRGRRLRLK